MYQSPLADGICLFNSSLWLWIPDTYSLAAILRLVECNSMQEYSASHMWSEGVCLFNSSLWLWFPDTYCTAEPRRSLEVAELRNKNNIAEGDNADNRNFNDNSNKNGRILRISYVDWNRN